MKNLLGLATIAFALMLPHLMWAQGAGATLSGNITARSAAAVPNANVSVKNVATGQATETQADSGGHYRVENLGPGEYELSVSAAAYSTATVKVTVVAIGSNTMDVTLDEALSLGDLGFSSAQTQGSTEEQARLDRRSHMLKVHQRLGLITAVPLVATVISGAFAGGRATHTTDRDLHAALGSVTSVLYFTTASYAIFAPKVPGTRTHGPIRLHKALAWIHGPGMILTPMLGWMAFAQRSRGERVHGIAAQHGAVAIVTAAAYGAAILSVSLKF